MKAGEMVDLDKASVVVYSEAEIMFVQEASSEVGKSSNGEAGYFT